MTLPPSCADCLEIYFLEPSGPVRACNVFALPLPAQIYVIGIYNGDFVSCEVLDEDEETSDDLKVTTETDGVLCEVRGKAK